MLRSAADQGITDIFATSHFNEVIPPEVESDYFNKLRILREEGASKNISVQLHSGSELFYHLFMDQTIQEKEVASLAAKRLYVLTEFSLFIMPTGVEETLFKLSMNGVIPIIAHPERYPAIQENYQLALDYLKYGAIFQVNAGSILGRFGKSIRKLSMWMLENKLVHFIGSDAHNTKSRPFRLQEAFNALKGHLDDEYIADLVEGNARKILESQKIEKVDIPESAMPEGFFKKLKKRFKLTGNS